MSQLTLLKAKKEFINGLLQTEMITVTKDWWTCMVNTEIRLIMFFAAKDGEALYSQQKQDQELTMAQIMNSLLPNSDWNWRK